MDDSRIPALFQSLVEEAGLTVANLAPDDCVMMFAFPCDDCGKRVVALEKGGDHEATVCEHCGARYEVLMHAAYGPME